MTGADVAAAHELADAVADARAALAHVLAARAVDPRRRAWSGPHRARHDEEARDAEAAGRALDGALAGVAAGLAAELDELASDARAARARR